MKILYIDDSNALLMAVASILTRAGFDVITSDNPMTAAFLVGKENPDVILLDLEMPALTGEELVASFTKYDVFDPAKIILFSSYQDHDFLESIVIKYGLGGFIAKSVLDLRAPLPFIEAIEAIAQ